MAYIGQDPVIGRYILVDQISGGFNGTASGFTLAAGGQGVLPGLAQNVLLSLGGVIQRPGTDYTISGSGLTFTTPPLSGTTFFATVLGDVQSVGTPSDGTVLPASIASSGTFPFPAVTIGSGTVSAPSLAIAGNVNTGLYSPGTNQLALTASGVSRLAIDASGKVGINAATPSYTLDVRGTGPDSAIWGYNIAQFVDTTANNTGFRVGVNTSTPGLTQLVAATTSAASQFGFWTYDGTNWGERVRIDGTGNVGIGGTPSIYKFDSIGNGLSTRESANSSRLVFGTYDAGGINYIAADKIGTGSYQPLAFQVNGAEKMRLTSTGLGIGTTSPGTIVDAVGTINSQGNAASIVHYQAQDTGSATDEKTWRIAQSQRAAKSIQLGIAVNDAGSVAYAAINIVRSGVTLDNIQFVTGSGSERLRIDSSGRVGIGISNVSGTNTRLEVSNDSAEIKVSSASAYNANFRGFRIGVAGDSLDYSGVRLQPNSGELRIEVGFATWGGFQTFYTNGLERLRIDSSGRVGINTTSPNTLLDVNGAITARGDGSQVGLYLGGGAAIRDSGTASITYLDLATGSASHGQFVVRSSNAYTERFRIDSIGNVGIGTSSPSELLHLSGGRILVSNINNTTGVASTMIGSAVGSYVALGASVAVLCENSGINTYGLQFLTQDSYLSGQTARMTITGAGRVGIGTTSPGYPLDVVSDSSAWGLNIRGRSADNIAYIRFSPNSGATTYSAIGTPAVNTLGFDVNGSERLRIDSSGRLLVGTSSSSGSSANTAPVLAGNFASFTGSVTASHNTATTLFTLPDLNANYLVSAFVGGTADANNYNCCYFVGTNASNSAVISTIRAGGLLVLSLSGMNVQVTQTSSASQGVAWSVTRIANI
jgi:hypothetical protein